MAKRGRPPQEKTRDQQYRLRLSSEEAKILEYLGYRTGKKKSEVLRTALINFYKNVLHKD